MDRCTLRLVVRSLREDIAAYEIKGLPIPNGLAEELELTEEELDAVSA